ncbi:Xaa-Pro dipeptidase [Motilimonas cestriensis]|uniref:Xaa-Pro dipeptidase n=1 Tax=Motilimonas cestriensis TaxID=2742685 RepID=UPI003DA518A2
MNNVVTLFAAHIAALQSRIAEALKLQAFDALIIHSGQLKKAFLDDQTYPFKANPHFKHWLPVYDNPNCWLVVNGQDKPKLIFYRPVDFWHKVPNEPDGFWAAFFDIELLARPEQVADLLPYDRANMAYIGEHIEVADALGIGQCNPEHVLNYLHFHRSYKTDYEMACLRQANEIAVSGHLAAKAAFFDGLSEFEINQHYLNAIGQDDNEVPYGNIVALNEHAAILHYSHPELRRLSTSEQRSFLIDAGANYAGYAADITRTYSARDDLFSELIVAVEQAQLASIGEIKVGMRYSDLHLQMHSKIAQILLDFKLAQGSVESLVAGGVTSAFFPHGLGHLLGLQVHDVAGFMQDERGTPLAPPQEHSFLRCTRIIEPQQVYTIEPGLYFIPELLKHLQQTSQQGQVNWQKVAELLPFGGIRIEDNIIIHQHNIENMTRDLGLS